MARKLRRFARQAGQGGRRQAPAATPGPVHAGQYPRLAPRATKAPKAPKATKPLDSGAPNRARHPPWRFIGRMRVGGQSLVAMRRSVCG